MLIGGASMENSMEVPQKINSRTIIYHPAILFLGFLIRRRQNSNSKRHMHSCVHCSIIHNTQDMEIT